MSPIDIQDILERAKYSSRVGDHEETERLLNNYLAKIPDSREAHLLLGATFAKKGQFLEAAEEFLALLVKDPEDIEAMNNAAVIYRRQGKFHEALEYLNRAIGIDPARAEFHYNIGNIHKQLGNSKSAAASYSKVVELDPNYVQAYNNLGTIYDQLGEHDKACKVFRKGLTVDHNNPTLHFNYGVSLEAGGRLEEAANEYQAALRSKPGWASPMNNLGIVQFKQKRHDKAIATFKKVLSVNSSNAEAYNNIGVVLADQGRTKEAVKNYRKAIENDHTYTKALVNLERILENTGDLGDAVLELEKLVKLSPKSADIRNRLAAMYLKKEQYPEALEQAEAALRLEGGSIKALRIKGAVLGVMGNADEAQKCFEKIVSLEPGNYSFLLDLADISFRRKEYDEAEKRIKSYLAKRPNDREAKMFLGKLYDEMGNSAQAIQIFEELSKADPNDTEALAAAAGVHKKTGSLEKALRAADTLVNLQGKRATANDLQELNKSLEFYENTVNEYSTSASEKWDRNIKLIAGEKDEEPQDDEHADVALLLGSGGFSGLVEEETHPLFTEAMEIFSGEEESGELIIGDDPFGEFPEENEGLYRNSLDSLAEETKEKPHRITPVPGFPPDPYGKSPYGNAVPPMAGNPWYPLYQGPVLPIYPQYADVRISPYPPKEEPIHPDGQEGKTPEPPEADEGAFPKLDFEENLSPQQEPEPYFQVGEEPFLHMDEKGAPQMVEESLLEEEALPPSGTESKEELVDFDELVNKIRTRRVKKSTKVPEVINLLVYLKKLTGGLPNKEKKTYSTGKYPAALESVIDSLKNLTIIKESAVNNK